MELSIVIRVDYPCVTMDETQKAFEIAGRVRKEILKRLPHDILL